MVWQVRENPKVSRIWLIPVVTVAAVFVPWRYNRRLGTQVVNGLVNPIMIREGLVGGKHSELGTLEHIGRVSGRRRLTPVRPVPTAHGFRIVVPLGRDSQWARNVLAAGGCRLRWRRTVYELDEPQLISASACMDVAPPIRLVAGALGVKYMRLHRFSWHTGTLEAYAGGDGLTSMRAPEPAGVGVRDGSGPAFAKAATA